MSAESLSLVAGTILSLVFSYVPKAGGSWEKLSPERKRLIMLGLLVLVSAVAYALACAGWADQAGIKVTCDQAGIVGLVRALIVAVIANQSAYAISPRYRRK